MCGIAGVVEFDPGRSPSYEGLRRMADVLEHRGPDESGFHIDQTAGLAHRRLSIIDLAAGKQPMGSRARNVWLVFNGEIYNFPDLRRKLEGKGYVFRTRSDTEVLLNLYLEFGLGAFPMLNGMFACAFWDGAKRELVLARDRMGKKPLFYCNDSQRFLFASEVKSLIRYGTVDRKICPNALDEYLSHGYLVGEETLLDGVRRLPPAHLLVAKSGKIEVRPYWELQFGEDGRSPSREEALLEELADLLQDAVRCRLMSDVPLGAFLSGGLDSSAVVAIMAGLSDRPVKTFTVGFEESEYSEIEDAGKVARLFGTDHHELIVRPNALEDLHRIVWYLDEPFGDSSAVPTYYVCRAAREHVTVALSGDGGDEIFAGYTRYLKAEQYRKMWKIPVSLRRMIFGPLTRALPFTVPGWNLMRALEADDRSGLPCKLGLFPYIKDRLCTEEFRKIVEGGNPFGETDKILDKVRNLDPVSQYQYLDTLQYLPCDILTKVDRMSMANSLEVRSPLLDYRLVEFMARLPVSFKLRDGISKYLLRKHCQKILPDSTLGKPKQGFALPQGPWFREGMASYARDILLDRRTVSRGYLRPGSVERMLVHHSSGRRDYSGWIWCLIVLEIWFRTFVDPDSIPDSCGYDRISNIPGSVSSHN